MTNFICHNFPLRLVVKHLHPYICFCSAIDIALSRRFSVIPLIYDTLVDRVFVFSNGTKHMIDQYKDICPIPFILSAD